MTGSTRRCDAIAVAAEEFPTDRYVVEGLAAARGLEIRWLTDDPIEGLTLEDIEAVVDEDLALLVLSHVNYRSAAIVDLEAVTERARTAGTLVLWDLSHSAGAIPVDLAARGADLAVGCTYKYLNGGPGAPGYLYIRRELQAALRPPIQGWFAQADQFEMGPRFEPRAGIGGWLVGTPGMLGLAAAEAGIAVSAEAGVDRIRAKGMALTNYAVELLDAWLAPLGCSLGSPRGASRRGNHISIRHPEARRLTGDLIARGVIPDYRAPDSIRVGGGHPGDEDSLAEVGRRSVHSARSWPDRHPGSVGTLSEEPGATVDPKRARIRARAAGVMAPESFETSPKTPGMSVWRRSGHWRRRRITGQGPRGLSAAGRGTLAPCPPLVEEPDLDGLDIVGRGEAEDL
ncbi:MAG: aminotransferase class V-fold PLP-dependent enzyme, partial [Chloroflexi bacterium]|nr:aminotransferase class V-fold PLP-dependent enzyme [Chloroflexota bacterium]